MAIADVFAQFLKSIDLDHYRQRFRPIKLVEMDLPKNIQAIAKLYEIYWTEKRFINYDEFYQEYLNAYSSDIEDFRIKITMCKDCFYRGLPARIYRTWASIITQIHAGYVAESVFGQGSVKMSEELNHQGADFQVNYKEHILNFQVKKETQSREVRQRKEVKSKIKGEFIDIEYKVPISDVFENPYTQKGEMRKPYKEFMENENLERFDNGFVVFTPKIFEDIKREIDSE